ncbi:MAG TPA: DUF1284 domain-containing protein [Thermodesulfovibrionales bacterium]|jgi:hypothetical protein|nr:DUF1284 domain-containing protein [Thermodesulfovibrionales bacterium]
MITNGPALKLRGHHLICLHFFRGEGYSAEFTANLREILKRAATGEGIEVASEADNVCNICPYLKGQECFYRKESDPEIRGMDREALMLLELKVRDIVLWPDIRKKIPAIFRRWSEEFCRVCDWRLACEKNAFFWQLSDEKT